MTHRTDHELIRLCQEGDAQSFRTLYERHRSAVMNFAFRLLGDRDAAADVLQETFTYLFRKLPDYRFEARLLTLLFKVARNLSINRAQKDKRALPRDLAEGDEPVNGRDPAKAAETSDLAQSILGHLDRLPDLYREIIVLRILEGLSCEEAAQVADCPVGTVKSRLHNGLELLREYAGIREPEA